jgi:opacity protein-like surface antigen
MMKKLISGFTTLALALTLCASTVMAGASSWMKDQYLDIYSGSAGYKAKNVTATIANFSLFGGREYTDTRKVDFSSSKVIGVRWGFWLEKDPLYGFAIDVSSQTLRGEDVKINLLPVSCMLFFRYPWHPTEKYPFGRLQPYGGIGFALISGSISADFTPTVPDVVNGGGEGTGIDLRAGLKWMFKEKTGFFAEVRYLQGSISINDEAVLFPPFIWSDTTEEASTTINSQQLLIGFSVKL